MLIVVAIIAMVTAGVSVAAYKYWIEAQIKTAGTNARLLRVGVRTWRMTESSSECPDAATLIRGGVLDDTSPKHDPWSNPWHVECEGDRIVVWSAGPDRQEGNSDDIRVPKAENGPDAS
jgi:hypothetical protein